MRIEPRLSAGAEGLRRVASFRTDFFQVRAKVGAGSVWMDGMDA